MIKNNKLTPQEKANKLALQEKWKTSQKQKKNKILNKNNTNTTSLADSYDPADIESSVYDYWSKGGYFSPEYNTANDKTFMMILPPPNVTGSLHIGHALTCSIEDLIARWHRMHNTKVLFFPGTDAGGIATQIVVERMLYNESGLTRHDLGREAFIEKVWAWKEKYGSNISTQLKRLGVSLDWSKEEFTMSKNLEVATQEAFIRCFDNGLITRDNRIVNWCPILQTCISDIECDDLIIDGTEFIRVKGHTDTKKYEFGTMWSFAYKVCDTDEEIIVSTTRPETIFGDTAVAVHPDDDRYKKYHNKFVHHPFLQKKIPIIVDKILVDMKLGTGAVKITPAHDPADYQCAGRNHIQICNILNGDGTLNEEVPVEFQNMMRYDARAKVIAKLKELDLYRYAESKKMTIKICSRSGDIIEPLLKKQWWMDLTELAEKVINLINTEELKIRPGWKIKELLHYLSDIQKWCLSRQTWWGNRIPAYQYWKENDLDSKKWLVAHNLAEAHDKACAILGTSDVLVEQDPDVLDTWFGSAIYPFSVLGWPADSINMQQYYPNSLLETGNDILFFWVAKMAMMGLQLTGQLPFKEVLLHGLVRDPNGEKMSKSKGNVIDPLAIIDGATLNDLNGSLRNGNMKPTELSKAIRNQKLFFPRGIKPCGTDALRFSLCAYANDGRDINLDMSRVEGYRKFCNKIWNGVKFSLMYLPDGYVWEKISLANLFDKWIISKFHQMLIILEDSFLKYDFMAFTKELYAFWWDNLCGVYLEAIKITKNIYDHNPVLCFIIDSGLRALHPVMPFITEKLYQNIPKLNGTSICVAEYPKIMEYDSDSDAIDTVNNISHLVSLIRAYMKNNNIQKRGSVKMKFSNWEEYLLGLYGKEILGLCQLNSIIYL